MAFPGVGFAVAVGVGLVAALFYFVSQAAIQPPYSNKSNNNNRPTASESVPYNNTWQEG
jgi:hypothetical protein